MNVEFAGGGARAMAMGGAFIGLADDATASEFNPAGLMELRRPEVAFQAIHTYDERYVGRLTGSGSDISLDFETDSDSYWVPSFASFAYPTQHFAVGVTEFTNIYFDRSYRDLSGNQVIEEEAANYAFGVTLALGIMDPLSLGTTVRYNRFRYDSGGVLDDTLESDEWSANFGVLWRLHARIQLGAVYKMPQPLKGDYMGLSIDTEIPETCGLGVAVIPSDDWRILADVDRIRWSKFDPVPEDDWEKEDVWRYHLGAEWCAGGWRESVFFLRAGTMYEESNAWRYEGDSPLLREFNSVRDPIWHYTLGVGLARPGYQLDIGFDWTDDAGWDLIGSVVYYF
jgi:long-subunit fatty acid transport protein